MKKKLPLIAIILIFTAGVCVLCYPFFSSVLNNFVARQQAFENMERIKVLPKHEKSSLYDEAKKYNQSLTDNVILTDPFDEKAYKRIGAAYYKSFDVDGKGLIGYIDVPKINVYLPVYHGTSEDVLEKYAGHLENTSLPIGGKSTHAVISAHSAFPGQTFFDYLTDITEGDEFYVHVLDRTLKYEVDQVSVVLPKETKALRISKGEDYVTLVTCTPYSVNSHRLLVRGKRVPYDEASYNTPPSLTVEDGNLFILGFKLPLWAVGIGLFVLIAAAVIIPVMIVRRRKTREDKK